jgi:hypothetical protein
MLDQSFCETLEYKIPTPVGLPPADKRTSDE